MRNASLVFTLFIGFSLSQAALAATVDKVKGSSVLISLDGDSGDAGDEFFVMDGSKKKGIVRISKVKGDKATGKLVKGKAQSGWSLKLRKSGGGGGGGGGSMDAGDSSSSMSSKSYIGGIFGFSNQSMSVKLDSGTTVNLAGSGTALKGLYDMQMSDSIWLRFMGGLFSFSTKNSVADAGCENAVCKVNISYLSLDIWGRYMLGSGKFKPWVGAGFDLVFPMSIDVNAVDKSTVKNSSIMSFGGGADWFLSRKSFIPIAFEYGMFPSSSDVKATHFSINVGYGMSF